MKFRYLVIALAIGIATVVLVLRCGRGRDRPIVYPEEPEPLKPWWNVTTTVPLNDFLWMG